MGGNYLLTSYLCISIVACFGSVGGEKKPQLPCTVQSPDCVKGSIGI